MIDAGRLNRRIIIQQRVQSLNSHRENVYTWATFLQLWAEVLPLRGREFFAASQGQEEVTTKFRIRYRTGIDHTMRVLYLGDPYDIVAPPIDPKGSHEFIELMTKKGVGDGR